MKIALLSGYDPTTSSRGGAEISFFTLAKSLVALGVEVHLITEPASNNLPKEELIAGVHFHRILNGLHKYVFRDGGIMSVMLSSKAVSDAVVKLNKNESFDLLHSCNRNTSTGAVIASKKLNLPSVLHVRDYWPFCPTVAFQRYYSDKKCGQLSLHCAYCHFQDFKNDYGSTSTLPWALYANFQTTIRKWYAQKASRIVAISNFVKNILIQNGFDKQRVSVVYNPVACEMHQNFTHQPNDKKVILFVGTLNSYKGIFDAIKAVTIVRNNTHINLELRIIGKGPAENDLKKLIKTSNLDFVNIVGAIPHSEMLKEYSQAQVAVLPFKRPEPFGRVVVEAMCAKVPVVSYATGAMPELITNGETGILVELDDIQMLANSIKLLLEDTTMRASIGNQASNVATKNYNPKTIAKNMLVIYEDLLEHDTN